MKLCECGCGLPAPIAQRTDTRAGVVKGQPRRFVAGHSGKFKYKSLADAFWRNVEPVLDGECWEWQGLKIKHGYGQVRYDHRVYLAHRLSYELHYGPIADGVFICHTCDNKCCVNPAHLFAGKPSDNSADMVRKDRQARGERNHAAKLNERDVHEILARLSRGETPKAIAAGYGVTPSLIGMIGKRQVWKHIEVPNAQL